jgi:hypothetical protein
MEALDVTAARALRDMLAAQPTTPAKIKFAWTIAAGQALARHATIAWTGDGRLHVHAESDAWRREILRAKTILSARLTQLLGPDVVHSIAVEAGAAGPRSSRA